MEQLFCYGPAINHEGYFIISTNCRNGKIMNRRDMAIAKILGIEIKELRNHMVNLFHAKLLYYSNNTRVMHFKFEDDAKAAVEWLEYTRALKTLR